jgi:hypothetical protein
MKGAKINFRDALMPLPMLFVDPIRATTVSVGICSAQIDLPSRNYDQ